MSKYIIKGFKPKVVQISGLTPLEYNARVDIAPGVTLFRVADASRDETWYWGMEGVTIHVKNYGKGSYPGDVWHGWIVTRTCGAEPPHYKSREAAFDAVPAYVKKTIRLALAESEAKVKELTARMALLEAMC